MHPLLGGYETCKYMARDDEGGHEEMGEDLTILPHPPLVYFGGLGGLHRLVRLVVVWLSLPIGLLLWQQVVIWPLLAHGRPTVA